MACTRTAEPLIDLGLSGWWDNIFHIEAQTAPQGFFSIYCGRYKDESLGLSR